MREGMPCFRSREESSPGESSTVYCACASHVQVKLLRYMLHFERNNAPAAKRFHQRSIAQTFFSPEGERRPLNF
ncbi:hypothetical protein PUN28_014316 [Cardiocondyla obscurior]|uniref:Uncharacterized protein n=1 Tax=Cardiocondyla obscurior TaxID=286306 RepID=A0AAW2EZH0_9HYME